MSESRRPICATSITQSAGQIFLTPFRALAIMALLFGCSTTANAADPTLVAASRMAVEQDHQIPFAIQLENTETLPKNSFVRIRGNLTELQLSEGHRISDTAWAVPLIALPRLRIKVTAKLAEPRIIRVLLVALDGGSFRTYASKEITLYMEKQAEPRNAQARGIAVMRAASALPVGTKPATPPPPPVATPATPKPQARLTPPAPPANQQPPAPAIAPAPPRRALAPAVRARAVRLMERGNGFTASGNYELARRFYRRAADLGLAEAAMAMASTYDPHELALKPVIGLQPDNNLANKWYTTARELGAPDATARLQRLAGR
ncbi:MAG TPA: hypothetical protein VMX97_05635 [Hyphomicrobiaceae bacterium]|nr:hypothetical protein [Hyphomicrobiaceae bacterium]